MALATLLVRLPLYWHKVRRDEKEIEKFDLRKAYGWSSHLIPLCTWKAHARGKAHKSTPTARREIASNRSEGRKRTTTWVALQHSHSRNRASARPTQGPESSRGQQAPLSMRQLG